MSIYEIDLPEHKCGLFLTHNEHRNYYETVETYLKNREEMCTPTWSHETARAECIESDELWALQWYPDTPVGSYVVWGPTVAAVLRYAHSINA